MGPGGVGRVLNGERPQVHNTTMGKVYNLRGKRSQRGWGVCVCGGGGYNNHGLRGDYRVVMEISQTPPLS